MHFCEIEDLQQCDLRRLTPTHPPQHLTPHHFHHLPSTLWDVCDREKILDTELAQNKDAAGTSILWKTLQTKHLPVSKPAQYQLYTEFYEIPL